MRTLGLSKAHGIMEREEREKRELNSVHATSWAAMEGSCQSLINVYVSMFVQVDSLINPAKELQQA